MATDRNRPASAPSGGKPQGTVDAAEVERFARNAARWWDPRSEFRLLHDLGPARLAFLREEFGRHFRLGGQGMKPFAGLTLLDVGCGGGIVSEPLARLGARVTGIDAGEETVAAARAHAEGQGLEIAYRAARAEDLAAEGAVFDALVCLEVVEHIPDPAAFLASCAALVRPGGLIALSTINRTFASYAGAIAAAEYVLGWLSPGTHRWERFVTPEELADHLRRAGFGPPRFRGLVFDPWTGEWRLGSGTAINYLAAAAKPE